MSYEILKFKLQRHRERLEEVFKRYSEKEGISDEKGDMVPVTTLASIFGDISYICGMIFCFKKEFETTQGFVGQKDSSVDFIQQFQLYVWRQIHISKLKKQDEEYMIMKSILRELSPDGYYNERGQTERRVKFEDEGFDAAKSYTLTDYQSFRKVLKNFIKSKNVVVIDLISEYTEQMKIVQKELAKIDLKANLLRTIKEYEAMLRLTDDEQQKQKIEKVIDQLKKELG